MTHTEYESMWIQLGYPSPPDNISHQGITYGEMTFSSLDAVWDFANLLHVEEPETSWYDLVFSDCMITFGDISISSCGADSGCLRVNALNAGVGIALPGGHCEDR